MKTLNDTPANNIFAIVRTSGINANVMITDKKNLGAHVASMLYGPQCGTKIYNVIVTDISNEDLSTLNLHRTKAYENRYCCSIHNNIFKRIMEKATEDNQYDVQECIESYKFTSFYLFFICRGKNEYFIMKANDQAAASDYIKSKQDFELIDTKRIADQKVASFLSMVDRFTCKETKTAEPFFALPKKVFEQLQFCTSVLNVCVTK